MPSLRPLVFSQFWIYFSDVKFKVGIKWKLLNFSYFLLFFSKFTQCQDKTEIIVCLICSNKTTIILQQINGTVQQRRKQVTNVDQKREKKQAKIYLKVTADKSLKIKIYLKVCTLFFSSSGGKYTEQKDSVWTKK